MFDWAMPARDLRLVYNLFKPNRKLEANMKSLLLYIAPLLLLAGCATTPSIPVDHRSVEPGSKITRGGSTELALLGEPIAVGGRLPAVKLVDVNLNSVDLSNLGGDVLLVSFVPSVDTQVCERQTTLLGEMDVPEGIRKVAISRDLPFAQRRFLDESGFDDILFLSDFQKADFGRASGLLVDEIYLLARGMLVVDRQGTIRYLQVVPEISHLPDMDKALVEAEALLDM